jgi:hypothetical protein
MMLRKFSKASTDYVAAQKSISATFDSDIEVITPDLQKIQFASSGQIKLSRPDKLRIRRTGGYADVEVTFDGKTLTIYGNNAKSYVQADEPGTVDHVVDVIQSAAGAGMPGTDLLLTDAYDEMMADVLDARARHSTHSASKTGTPTPSPMQVPSYSSRHPTRQGPASVPTT